MKIGWILVSLLIVLFTGCETTDDILDTLDHTVPAVQFNPYTLEVTASEKVTLNALLSDESGIQRIEFTYGNWKINTIVDLSAEPVQPSYTFTTVSYTHLDVYKGQVYCKAIVFSLWLGRIG